MMAPAHRKFWLAVHLIVSVGWIGAVAAYIAFDVTAAAGLDAEGMRDAFLAMDRIARNVIVPFAVASVVTGVVVSLGSKWGLFRHYWVVISLLLTTFATIVLIVETRTIASLAEMATDPATSVDELRSLPSTLVHSLGGTVVLLVVLVLNVYKPRGMTRYGRRRERDQPPPRDGVLTRATRPSGPA